jgi:hypothetical protein
MIYTHIGPSQRRLPDNTQQSQETDSQSLGGTRTRSPSKRVAADPCLISKILSNF